MTISDLGPTALKHVFDLCEELAEFTSHKSGELTEENAAWLGSLGTQAGNLQALISVLELKMARLWCVALQRLLDDLKKRFVDSEVWAKLMVNYNEAMAREHLVDNAGLDNLLQYLSALVKGYALYLKSIHLLPNKPQPAEAKDTGTASHGIGRVM